MNNGFTISFWSKDDISNDNDHIILADDPSNGYRLLAAHLPWRDSIAYFDIHDSSNTRLRISTTPAGTATELSHWILTKEVSGTNMIMKLWKNGILETSGTFTNVTWTASGKRFRIGVNNSGDSHTFKDKSLENFRIYNRVLSAAEVQQLYESQYVLSLIHI